MSNSRTGSTPAEFGDLDACHAAEEVSLNRSILIAVACGLKTFWEVEAKLTKIYFKKISPTDSANSYVDKIFCKILRRLA